MKYLIFLVIFLFQFHHAFAGQQLMLAQIARNNAVAGASCSAHASWLQTGASATIHSVSATLEQNFQMIDNNEAGIVTICQVDLKMQESGEDSTVDIRIRLGSVSDPCTSLGAGTCYGGYSDTVTVSNTGVYEFTWSTDAPEIPAATDYRVNFYKVSGATAIVFTQASANYPAGDDASYYVKSNNTNYTGEDTYFKVYTE